MSEPLLEVTGLEVSAGDVSILQGVDLTIKAGEMHVIMGPNGSGKSTLARALAGHPDCRVDAGKVRYAGSNLLDMEPEERAQEGLFLAFQHPVEIPGVGNAYLLKSAVNAIRRHRGEPELDAIDFLHVVHDRLAQVGMGEDMLKRAVNMGFSGGEQKRNELLQLALLEPRLAILDEIDSGLDVDGLNNVCTQIVEIRTPERAMILVTHNPRLLHHLEVDHVHIMAKGRLVRSGGVELAGELEQGGYAALAATAG